MEKPNDLNIVGALLRRWALVVLLTSLGAIAGYGASQQMSPVYEGTASLLVGDFDNSDVSSNEIEAMQSLASTYADIARRAPVLTEVVDDLGLSMSWTDLSKSVHIRVPDQSPQVIEITVEGSSARWAKSVSGAVSRSLVDYVDQTTGQADFVSPQLRELETSIEAAQRTTEDLLTRQERMGVAAPASLERQVRLAQDRVAKLRSSYASFKQLASSSSHVAIRVLDPADAGRDPVSPVTRFNTLMAGFVGFLLALATAYLLESRRNQHPGSDEPSNVEAAPTLPSSPRVAVHTNGRDVRVATASGVSAEHQEGETR